MLDIIKCPHCSTVNEPCYFPDLFYSDCNNSEDINKQVKIQEELQYLGYDIVTCGNCGQVFIIKR